MSSVAGEALTEHLSDILPALLSCISQASDEQQLTHVCSHTFREDLF
jgi:hypothetical protein